MRLLVVIVNYKVTDLTLDCLRSLENEIPRVYGTQVAVVENGSGGDAESRIRAAIESNGWASWCELTAIHPNRGFTGGNNAVIVPAMRSADPPQYVYLLNADTLVIPGALEAIVKFMDAHPHVGIAGSQLEWPDGRVAASPFRFEGFATELDRGFRFNVLSKMLSRWAIVPPKPAGAAEVDWVAGAGMIIRREVIEAIGALDEDYFTYYDDIDYCLNAKRAGWPTWFVPASRVIHFEGRSTGIKGDAPAPKRRPKYWYQARRRFFLKNYGPLYAMLVDAAFIAGFAVWRLRRPLQRKPDTDPPMMLWDQIRHSVFATGFKLTPVENPAMVPPLPAPSSASPAR